MYCGLVRVMDFFFLVLLFYYHTMFVKVMDTIISSVFIRLLFCAEFSKIVMVSIGPYSCVLCRMWRTYTD